MVRTTQTGDSVSSLDSGVGGELIIYLKDLKSSGVLPKKYLLNKQHVFWSDHHASYDEKDRIISYVRSNEQINMTYSADDTFVKKQNTVTNVQTSYYISPLNPLQKVEIITPTQTKTITYLTDGELKRSAKLVNGIIKNYYLYDKQGRLVAELNPNQTLKSRFVYDANNYSPDLMIDIASGERYNFIKDQLGSILSVLTQNNQSKQQLRYDVFGAVTQDTNPGFQPFGFAGGHYDFDTGLVRFGARDYDADTARWLVRDPIRFQGGDTNLYGYCGNDFVNCVDPSGLFVPLLIPAAALAYSVGYGAGTLFNDLYVEGNDYKTVLNKISKNLNICKIAAEAVFNAALDDLLGPVAPAAQAALNPDTAKAIDGMNKHNQQNDRAFNEAH